MRFQNLEGRVEIPFEISVKRLFVIREGVAARAVRLIFSQQFKNFHGHLSSSLPMETTIPKTDYPKATDSVLSELRRVKTKLLERFDYDLAAMARDARARQGKSGHRIIIKPPET